MHAARLPWLQGGCPHPQPRLSIAAIPHSLPITPSFQHPPLPPLACLHSSKCSGHYQCLHFCLCLCCLHFEGNKVQLCLLTRNLYFSPRWALFFPPAPSTPRLVPSITPWLIRDPPGGAEASSSLGTSSVWLVATCPRVPQAKLLGPGSARGLTEVPADGSGHTGPPAGARRCPPLWDNASG